MSVELLSILLYICSDELEIDSERQPEAIRLGQNP